MSDDADVNAERSAAWIIADDGSFTEVPGPVLSSIDGAATRSRVDRYGQLAFTLVVCGIAGWGGYALVSLIPVEWAQISVGAIAALMWLLLVSTGISAPLAKTKKP